MRASPRIVLGGSSTARAFAGLTLALAVAGCGGSPATPSPGPSLRTSPAVSPTASPRPMLAPNPAPSPTTPSGVFTLAAPYAATHQSLRAALLPDGRVLVLDGPTDPQYGPISNAVELYDPKTNTFQPDRIALTRRSRRGPDSAQRRPGARDRGISRLGPRDLRPNERQVQPDGADGRRGQVGRGGPVVLGALHGHDPARRQGPDRRGRARREQRG